jgi:periplasmic protein TonB
MMTRKFLILFVLASLAGHSLVLALTTRIYWAVTGSLQEKVITVELNAPPENKTRSKPTRPKGTRAAAVAGDDGIREDSVALQGELGPYSAYLRLIRRRIDQIWSYPPQAISEQREGNAVISFTIDASGALQEYHVTSTSGSTVLDEEALAVVRAAAPYAPLPADFNLARLHITATFSYRMAP